MCFRKFISTLVLCKRTFFKYKKEIHRNNKWNVTERNQTKQKVEDNMNTNLQRKKAKKNRRN